MGLHVTKEAARWYKEEMGLADGDYLRFFVKLYGGGIDLHPNFSLGIAKEEPRNIATKQKQEGITFYFDEQDEWFIEGMKLIVSLKNGEAHFTVEKD